MGIFVYVISEPNTGFVKIGIANNPVARLAGLQTGNPRKLDLIFERPMPNRRMAEQAEFRAHGGLLRWRVSGEWFLVPNDVAIQEAEWACNFVQNHSAANPRSPEIRRRDMGFDYKASLSEELAAEAAEHGAH